MYLAYVTTRHSCPSATGGRAHRRRQWHFASAGLLLVALCLCSTALAQVCVTCWNSQCPQKRNIMPPCSAAPVQTNARANRSPRPSAPVSNPKSAPVTIPITPKASLLRGVRFVADPPGATIVIDGQPNGPGLALKPGMHRVTARLAGYRPLVRQFYLSRDLETVRLSLERDPTPAPVPTPPPIPTTAEPRETTYPVLQPSGGMQPLPRSRRILAGWLGTSAGIALGTGIALTILWTVPSLHIRSPDNSCGQMACQYDLRPHIGVSYAITGVTLVGMILSLTLPDRAKAH